MEISNFSSLIEVGVALNIACVAIEYVKSYNDVLCNQVFNLEHKIETAVKECRSKLNEVMDVTTLTNLPNTVIGGRNTEVLKQRLLRSRERRKISSPLTSTCSCTIELTYRHTASPNFLKSQNSIGC